METDNNNSLTTDLSTFSEMALESSLPVVLKQIFPVIEEARKEVGFAQTKAEQTLGNLQFSGETPVIWIKQCFAQIEQKVQSLHESYWNIKEQKLKIKKYREKGDELSMLKADKLESGLLNMQHYVQEALKDIQVYQDAAERIREKHNLPAQMDREFLDEASKKEHIRKAMRQAFRDVENFGTISKGVAEHLEHYGIHPQTAKFQIDQYRAEVFGLMKEGKVPTMEHLHIWLDRMEAIHLEGCNAQLKYMKLIDEEMADA